jgi:hypothetical protein
MKIFNVSLRVSITQIAELPDNPPTEAPKPFNDNPLKAAEALFDRAERFMAPRVAVPGFGGMYPGEGDGAQFTQSVRIQAETYEDLQSVLKMFADTVKAINKVPDSLLKEAVPAPSFGQ